MKVDGEVVRTQGLRSVCFYVRKSIATSDRKVTAADKNMVATLSLMTSSGQIDVQDVYSRRCRVDMDMLRETCPAFEDSPLMGDFNVDHEH